MTTSTSNYKWRCAVSGECVRGLILSAAFLVFGVEAWAADCVAPPVGLVAWWSAEGNAVDRIGGNNGTMRGAATFSIGEVGQAFDFDGINASVLVPDSPALRLTKAMTIEAWIYPRSSGGHPREIVAKWFGAPDQLSYTTAIEASGQAYFLVSSSGRTTTPDDDYKVVYTTRTVPLHQWSHFAATYDGSSMRIYLNGILENEVAWTNGIFPGTGPLVIGECYSESLFDGLIDEPALYNRALSPLEIASVYSAGSLGKCMGPLITVQPEGQEAYAGQTVTLSVTAVGDPPLGYQWQRAGTNLEDDRRISGSSSSVLTVDAVQLSDVGDYGVIITNGYGSITSALAMLTVFSAPRIIVQPQSQQLPAGSNVSFTVSVAAYPLPSYQWFFNGTNILGATAASLSLTNVFFHQSGKYSVSITNPIGYAVSTEADLLVLSPPEIVSEPRSEVVYWGLDASFQVKAVGTLPFTYQWYFENFPIDWGTNGTLDLHGVGLDAAGVYSVRVSNPYGSVISQAAALTVNPASVSPGTYFGLTITGAVGKRFGVQFVTNVSLTNSWKTITNLTLIQPEQLWIDTTINLSTNGQLRRYYRAVPVP